MYPHVSQEMVRYLGMVMTSSDGGLASGIPVALDKIGPLTCGEVPFAMNAPVPVLRLRSTGLCCNPLQLQWWPRHRGNDNCPHWHSDTVSDRPHAL